jgi:hypothetical protein
VQVPFGVVPGSGTEVSEGNKVVVVSTSVAEGSSSVQVEVGSPDSVGVGESVGAGADSVGEDDSVVGDAWSLLDVSVPPRAGGAVPLLVGGDRTPKLTETSGLPRAVCASVKAMQETTTPKVSSAGVARQVVLPEHGVISQLDSDEQRATWEEMQAI